MSKPSAPTGEVSDQVKTKPETHTSKDWMLVLHNNDVTPFDVVIHVLMEGLGFSGQKAYELMSEAHNKKYSIVFKGPKSVCEVKKLQADTFCQQGAINNPYARYEYLKFSIEEIA